MYNNPSMLCNHHSFKMIQITLIILDHYWMNNQIINKSGSRIRIHWLTSMGPVAEQQLMEAKHELRRHPREMEIKFRLVR